MAEKPSSVAISRDSNLARRSENVLARVPRAQRRSTGGRQAKTWILRCAQNDRPEVQTDRGKTARKTDSRGKTDSGKRTKREDAPGGKSAAGILAMSATTETSTARRELALS